MDSDDGTDLMNATADDSSNEANSEARLSSNGTPKHHPNPPVGALPEKYALLNQEVPPYVRFYSDQLKFLWEQYIKFIQMGILAAVLTVGFLMQFVVANETTRNMIKIACYKSECDTSMHLGIAIIAAALGALCFVLSRWCSQLLMERQVYGQAEHAKKYFELTNTVLPTAIEPKYYTTILGIKESFGLLTWAGRLNEVFKFLGIICVICSWAYAIRACWPLVLSLSRISPV